MPGERPSLADLDEVISSLRAVLDEIKKGGAPAELEQRVWDAYLKTETAVVLTKLRHSIERPGVFITLPVRADLGDYIAKASESLLLARERVAEADHEGAFDRLRGARNELRAYLTVVRNTRLRELRAKKRRIS